MSQAGRADDAQRFDDQRPRLFAIAYQLTGSVADAEDAVQEAWAAWVGADRTGVYNPAGYLTRLVTHKAVDALRARQRRRESYPGSWLPEPLPTAVATPSAHPDPQDAAELADEVTTGLLVLLETLTPEQRAAFVLHEAFGLPHDEIAGLLDRTPAAVRKGHSRARAQVRGGRTRFRTDRRRAEQVAQQFLGAAAGGDLQTLVTLLEDGAVVISDGGGKVSAARRVVQGAEQVARFMIGIAARVGTDLTHVPTELGGLPALASWDLTGARPRLDTVTMIETEGDRVSAVYVQRNPDKLRHLEWGG